MACLNEINMQTTTQIHLSDVQTVYSGPEGQLWELLTAATPPPAEELQFTCGEPVQAN